MGKNIKRYSLLAIILLSVTVGCSGFKGSSSFNPFKRSGGSGTLKKIAVLPFDNISERKDAGRLVADAYITELFNSGRFRVEEPGNIMQFYRQERLQYLGEIDLHELEVLGRRLRLDGVIVGTVVAFDDGRRGPPLVEISARLLEPSSGSTVWAMEKKRRGDEYRIIFDFGEVVTATTLARRVAKEMLETLDW